jgi:hypothetical protein
VFENRVLRRILKLKPEGNKKKRPDIITLFIFICLLVCSLTDDAVSIVDFIASND